MFSYAQVRSDWLRISSFAGRRMARIERILGHEVCQPLREAVEARFAEDGGDLWKAFKADDTAARDRLRRGRRLALAKRGTNAHATWSGRTRTSDKPPLENPWSKHHRQ